MENKIQEKPSCPSRREFLSKAGALAALTACSSAFAALLSSCEYSNVPTLPEAKTLIINIADKPELSKVGGAFQYPTDPEDAEKPVYNIIRISEKNFLVVEAHCTHQGCIVPVPATEEGKAIPNMICPCHRAEFSSLNGNNTVGPNTGGTIPGLKRFPASYNADTKELTLFLS